MKEKLLGSDLVGATCLRIFHNFLALTMFFMILFLIHEYSALALAISLTTWFRIFLYIVFARIFEIAIDDLIM